jgi:glucosamine-phosphate N-acetyltransferase
LTSLFLFFLIAIVATVKPLSCQIRNHQPNTATMNGTTHASTDSLFPASLISPAVAAALPEAYTIRPLQRGDYAAGFLDVLRVLTTVGEVPQADFEARFDEMKQTGNGAVGTHVLVILDGEGKVVGTGALLVERKLYVSAPDL